MPEKEYADNVCEQVKLESLCFCFEKGATVVCNPVVKRRPAFEPLLTQSLYAFASRGQSAPRKYFRGGLHAEAAVVVKCVDSETSSLASFSFSNAVC